jgi:hypothetical protein
MKLTDSLSITSASADLPELLRGHLLMEFALDAFSGNIQGELRSAAREEHLDFESSGTFSNISVAQLGAFFSQDAEGSIKEGKFTFRGSPRDLARATFTTRFEAGAFRWGARRWNSLVAGATYVHHHLQNLEFQLTQAHNSLMLKGDMDVPENWNQWWRADFIARPRLWRSLWKADGGRLCDGGKCLVQRAAHRLRLPPLFPPGAAG